MLSPHAEHLYAGSDDTDTNGVPYDTRSRGGILVPAGSFAVSLYVF